MIVGPGYAVGLSSWLVPPAKSLVRDPGLS